MPEAATSCPSVHQWSLNRLRGASIDESADTQKSSGGERERRASDRRKRAAPRFDEKRTIRKDRARQEQAERHAWRGGERDDDQISPADITRRRHAGRHREENGRENAQWSAGERRGQHGPGAGVEAVQQDAGVHETEEERNALHRIRERGLEMTCCAVRATGRGELVEGARGTGKNGTIGSSDKAGCTPAP